MPGDEEPTAAPEWRPLTAAMRAARRLASRVLRRGRSDLITESPPAPDSYVEISGGRIYVDPQDGRGSALVEAGGDFNPLAMAMWRALLAEGRWTHIVDAGANYGEMLFAIPCALDATVLAIEPNPYLLPHLRRTVRESGLRAEVVAAVAGERPGRAVLKIDRTWSGMSSVRGRESAAKRHHVEVREVEAVTLASLLGEPSGMRLLVKIDVEEHEAAVLRGLGAVLSDAADFAALVEVMHLPDDDLDWIASRFAVSLWDQRHGRLVPVDASTGPALRALLAGGAYYALDAALRRRPA